MALHSPTAPRTPRCSSHGRRPPRVTATGPRHRNGRRQLSPEQRRFAESHLNLAKQQARRFANRHGIPFDDLLGAAYEGLCKAALGFDTSLGHRPSSYIVPKVKGELLHHLRDTGFLLRVSHRMRELWMKARRPLALGNSDADIALELGIELGEWLEVRQACGQRPVPLEEEPPAVTSGSW
jgi:RNA polymerase sigma-B factor